MVVPAARRMELQWFVEQLARLNSEGLIPYHELVSIRGLPSDSLRWAAWGKTMWRFHRAWAAARVSGGFPWSVWGERIQSIPLRLLQCPLCGLMDVDLVHLLGSCHGTSSLRLELQLSAYSPTILFHWALADTFDVVELKSKVRYVGLCLVMALTGKRRKPTVLVSL